jgi:5-methylcytosine-specific restriction endonuclease McrA
MDMDDAMGYQSANEGWETEPPRKRKRKSLPAAVRMAVWNRWFGVEKGTGDCQCCGRMVYQQDFECGHVLAHSKGGADTVDNLRPICRTCNRSMGDHDFDTFKDTYWKG